MLRIAILAVAVSAAVGMRLPASAHTVFENWSEKTASVRIDADGKVGWINAAPEPGRKQGRFLGMMGSKLSDLSKVRLSFNEGRLVVDTSDCDLTQRGAFIRVCFAMPVGEIPCGSEIDFVAEMKALPGARWEVGHNGAFVPDAAPTDQATGLRSAHYWNVRPRVAENASLKPCVYSRSVPTGLKNLQFDFRLESQGVFEFGKVSWEIARKPEPDVDPKRNLLVNGGAERGWFGTAMANIVTYSETGKYIGQDGHWFTTPTVPAIDTGEKHSGRASFRFHVEHDRKSIPGWGPYNMEFNQIPVVPGKPLVFTCWAKADQNGRRMDLRLKADGGGSYIGWLSLTTEWKRYKLLVNRIGETQKGSHGNLGVHSFGLVAPRLDFVSPGTFWVDDCAVFQAEDGDYELEPVCVSGAINKKSAVYYAGEKIGASIKVARGAGRKDLRDLKVSSKALDFRGEVVATTAEHTVSLEGGEAEFSEELKLPAEFRGPVQWLFTVSEGDEEVQTAGFGLGVIDARKPLLKRFGYNIHDRVNMPRLLELIRDFRIGSVRVWDGPRQADRNFEMIHLFHKNGIDVLYCFSNAGVLPGNLRYLVVKDPTEWQEYIAGIVTKVRGEVLGYEILNEPNARSGMGRNPDPEKYDLITPKTDAWCIKVATEEIKKHDDKALIVGPTTCHTDLGWTFDVLGRGAVEHLDVISEHPYCAMPEIPDLRKQVETLIREGSRMKGKPMRSWATERGKTTMSNPENGCIYPSDARGAAKQLRTMIVSYAGGTERFFDFMLGTHNIMFNYLSIYNGNPDNDYMARPSCLLYAQRALMDLIEDAPCVKELPVGVASRAYVFDRGDRRVVALWKFQGEPKKVKLPRAALVYDLMGTPSQKDEITLDEFPQYIVTQESVEQLEKLIATLDFGPVAAEAEERREQLKVPFFEKDVDWSKAAVVAGKPCKFGIGPKPGDALEVRLVWNRSGLTMRVVVEKDGFNPEGDLEMSTWQGDGLQIAFDTMKNAQKGGSGYDDEDFEYDIAMFKGKPLVYRRRASLAYHDSLHKPLGVVDDVALDIERDGRKTVYLIRFSPQSVSPFRLNEGESMRFAVLANLADGEIRPGRFGRDSRYGALETAPGVERKRPYDFQEMVLVGGAK